jgi:hypothetical protein
MRLPIVFTLLIIYAISCKPKETIQEPTITEDGWQILINQNLTDWDQVGMVEAAVNQNVLTLSALESHPNAMLVSKMEYDNFELEFDFQTNDTELGIMFRFNDLLSTVPQEAGYMISTDFSPDQLNPAGTILNVARATVPEDINSENWNSMRLEASGTLMRVYLNQTLVAEGNDKSFRTGKLALQVPKTAGTTASFKNIRIRPLATTGVATELLEEQYRSDSMKDWDTLFDGTTLNGWNPVGDGSWEVVEGAIHGFSGVEGGFLIHDNTYKDFYLKTTFKIIKEDNSGIFIRKSPDSTAVTITDAIECNIYDHNGPSHAYSTGSIATHARAWYGMIDYNDWNEMEIFAKDEHIVMFVNGQKSSESYLPEKFDKAGNICLQGGIKVFAPDKGPSNVYFREVLVKSFD